MELLGIFDIWVESEIFGEIIVGNIFRGKLWNCVIRVYKFIYEVFWRVFWLIIVVWVRDGGYDDEGELVVFLVKLVVGFFLYENGLMVIDFLVYRYVVNEMGYVFDIIV